MNCTWLPVVLSCCLSVVVSSQAKGVSALAAPMLSGLPIVFEENRGQADRGLAFVARGPSYTVGLTSAEALVRLRGSSVGGNARSATLSFRLVGGSTSARLVGMDEDPGKMNYYVGRSERDWHTGIRTYRRVSARDVYPGIDIVYRGLPRELAYDFVVRPGADPHRIRLAIGGVRSVRLDRNGDLVLSTGLGALRKTRPVAHQVIEGRRVSVPARFVVYAHGAQPRIGFRVGRHDSARTLVIDPTIVYSTLLGGGTETGTSVKVDGTGCTYISGFTASAAFPRTTGSYGASPNYDGYHIFVTKFSSDGRSLLYSAMLGNVSWQGNSTDQPPLGVDASGCAIVGWMTTSAQFPTTPGAIKGPPTDGATDVFLTKLSPAGDSLEYSTCIGGAGRDLLRRIAVDASGSVVLACGLGTNISTPGAYTAPTPGSIYLAKVNPTGTGFVWAARLWDYARINALAVDGLGCSYLAGQTFGSPFPATPGAYVAESTAGTKGFVMKLQADGSSAAYATLLSPSVSCEVMAMTVDRSGRAYVTGWADLGYPTTPGAYCRPGSHSGSVFITKLAADGRSVGASSLIGTSSTDGVARDDSPPSVGLDAGGNVVHVSSTTWLDLPTTTNALKAAYGPGQDVGVVCLDSDLTGIAYGSYLGGSESDSAWGVQVDDAGVVSMVGGTTSHDFPLTPDAFQSSRTNHGYHGFLTRISFPWPSAATMGSTNGEYGSQVTLTAALRSGEAHLDGQTIAFTVDGVEVGTAVTDGDGVASLYYTIASDLPLGDLEARGMFAGSERYLPAAATAALTTRMVQTRLSTIDRSGTITHTVVLRAYLRRISNSTGILGKTIAFSIDGTAVGSAESDATGRASLPWTISCSSGQHAIDAAFAGDACFEASQASAVLTATVVTTKTYVPARSGEIKQPALLRAYLYDLSNAGIPGKSLMLSVDGTAAGEGPTDSTGRLQLYYTVPEGGGAGSRATRAVFAGNAGYTQSSGTGALTVLKGHLHMWTYVRTGVQGRAHPLKAYVRSLPDYAVQPGKAITFRVDGTDVGSTSVNTSGWAVVSWAIPQSEPTGAHTAAAVFAGDAWYNAQTKETSFNVIGP